MHLITTCFLGRPRVRRESLGSPLLVSIHPYSTVSCAGSGKTVAAELAVFRVLSAHPGAKAVYIAPIKALVAERVRDWQRKLGGGLGLTVVELTGDSTPDAAALRRADIIITTPEKWDGVSRDWQRRRYVQDVSLVILDGTLGQGGAVQFSRRFQARPLASVLHSAEIHLLGEERGPVLEVIVSRMRYMSQRVGARRPMRFVGLSTALANAKDVADWLGVGPIGLFNFKPSVRPVPMTAHIQGFPGKHYCPRMASMNKPAYAAITTYSPEHPVLVFVASRRQTRLTALEFIALCAGDENPKRFLHMPEEDVAALCDTRVRDDALRHALPFGIAIHHAGLCEEDRSLGKATDMRASAGDRAHCFSTLPSSVEELFLQQKIQVLVCTATLGGCSLF